MVLICLFYILSLLSFIHLSFSPPPEHWNYFGTDEKLGPVALSIRREKLDDTKDLKDQYQYRIIFRTNEVGMTQVGFPSKVVNLTCAQN